MSDSSMSGGASNADDRSTDADDEDTDDGHCSEVDDDAACVADVVEGADS